MHLKLIFLFFFSVAVNAGQYKANLKSSHWDFAAEKTLCSLKQKIPHYGKAEIIHRSGKTLVFSIYPQNKRGDLGAALVKSIPPAWSHNGAKTNIYPAQLEKKGRKKRIFADGAAAERMLSALKKGYFVKFSYTKKLSKQEKEDMKVAVSSVSFQKIYDSFEACRDQLLPYGYDDLHQQTLYFDQGSSHLIRDNKELLGTIAEYLTAMPDTDLQIQSSTSDVGYTDKYWFKKRCQVVKEALLRRKVEADRVFRADDKKSAINNHHDIIELNIFGPDNILKIPYGKQSIRLGPLDQRKLNLIAQYLDDYLVGHRINIHSHTDSIGSRVSNQKVSERRGNAVKLYMIKRGIDEDILTVKAHGEDQHVKRNRTPKGRAQNRRVVIEFETM